MTTVEKRRSGRKSGGRRKRSDRGYSDTSSASSFPDENDREVSNLTDRAFRSLCIGDEAVYNDSDVNLSSPSTQRDKQLAFSQHGRDRERDELKRTAHENFSLRVQHYGEDWMRGGMYGSEIPRDPQWEVYGDRTHGVVSATFQHTFLETSQQDRCLREEQMSILRNGATELNSQQLRSRSRVSSLIRAFNSEGQSDAVGIDDQCRNWNDETRWDKSSLMTMQRELSKFSTSYQQNFNSGYFPSADPFSSPDTNYYSSEVAAVAQMSHNSAASFLSSAHGMSAQVNCNSNFFIHSEFSPFKVWRNHNRFPFQHGQVSGFMQCSEFPKWYKTPMYRELSLHDRPQAPCGRLKHTHMAQVVPNTAPRSTSTSTVIQKASAMEKRCESELAGQYLHRKKSQCLGSNKLPSQRPSTATPTAEMSRRVRDTISSVKALQEKMKKMAEKNSPGVINEQAGYYYNNNVYPCENNEVTVEANVSENTSTTPFKVSQTLTNSSNSHQEAEDFSAPPVEHPPVRAESRGATPDVRMSSYKSRATSLLFNLKDNRKRVKSTYSPTKFKSLENQERNKQPSKVEPADTVIDIPDFPDPCNQLPQFDDPTRTNAAAYQHANQYQSSFLNSHATQYPGYPVSDDQTVQMQGQMAHHSGFPGIIPGNYTSSQLTNGQNLHVEGVTNTIRTLEEGVYRQQQSSTVREEPKLNAESNHTREYLQSKTNYEQSSNEPFGNVFRKVDRYEQLKDSIYDYNSLSSQDMYRQTYSQSMEKQSLKEEHQRKEDIGVLMERTRQENQSNLKKDMELRESFGAERSAHLTTSNQSQQCAFSDDIGEPPTWYGDQESLALRDKNGCQRYSGLFEKSHQECNGSTNNDSRHPDQGSWNQHGLTPNKPLHMQKQNNSHLGAPTPKGVETQIVQPIEINPSFEPRIQKHTNDTSDPVITSPIKDRQFTEIKAENQQAELGTGLVQLALLTAEPATTVLADQTHSDNIRAEEVKSVSTQQEMLKQPEAENTEEKKTMVLTVKPREKQNASQKVLEEPADTTNEIKHVTEEQSQQAKTEQMQKVNEIKTEVSKTALDAQTRFQQTQLENATRTNINVEKFKNEQLSKVQVTTKQTDIEQVRTENFENELVGTANGKAEETLPGENRNEQFKSEQAETTVGQLENVITAHIKDVKQANDHKDLVHVDEVKVEQQTQVSSSKERKLDEKITEKTTTEKTKMDEIIPELSKAQIMQQRSTKLITKLTATQPARSGPDKVEQVKTELAKAKAELARIKEKMRSEQKEKIKNITVTKDGNARIKAPVQQGIGNTEGSKTEKQEAQMQPRREIPAVRNSSHEPDRGADEYNRLREKYGFIDAVSTNQKKVSAPRNPSLTDNKETQALYVDKPDTVNKEKATHVAAPALAENTEGAGNLELTEVTEGQYVYSVSSKEFKLSCASEPKTKRSKEDDGKPTDDNANKLGKSEPVKEANVSLHKDPDSTKVLSHKTKANDHSFIPPKALSHKERAQTKQEILTSKIKAHAEKEISAIKEKGLAMRDGSKSFGKLLPNSHSANIRQKLPSHDTHKKIEAMTSSNVTTKDQMDYSRVQLEPNSSTFGLTTASANSSAAAIQPDDHLLKLILQKSTKANSKVREQPGEPKQAEGSSMNTNGSAQNIQQERNPEILASRKTNEEAAKNEQENLQGKPDDISIKQKEELKDTPVEKTDIHNAKTDYPPAVTEIASEIDLLQEAPHEDSEASLNLFLGQKEDSIVDDGLQIMGIKVTVRDRTPPADPVQRHNTISKLLNATEEESSDCVHDQGRTSTYLDEREKATTPNEAATGKVKDKEQSHSVVHEDGIKVGPKNEHKALISETRNYKEIQDLIETNLQQDGSINAKPQSETKPESLVDKEVTVTQLSNKELVETPSLHDKQDNIARETKYLRLNKNTEAEVKTEGQNPQKIQTPKSNNNQKHNGINSVSYKEGIAETHLKHGVHPPEAEDQTSVINQTESSNNGVKAPLLEETRLDPALTITFNKTSSSSNFTGNENTVVVPKQQCNEKHVEEKFEKEDNLHIGSIAIKVVPAATMKDKVNHSKTFLGFVLSEEQTQTAISICKENTLNNEDTPTELSPSCCGEKLKDNLNEKLEMQQVFDSVHEASDSLKSNNPSSTTSSSSRSRSSIDNTACQNSQPENAEPDSVKVAPDLQDESNIQLESDYFQVQRVKETNSPVQQSLGAAAGTAVKERELPNKTLYKESHKEEKIDAFVFVVDKDKSKTEESSSASSQRESVKGEICKTKDALDTKQTDGSTGILSNNEKMETSQTNQPAKHPTEHESSLSVTERHSLRRLHPKRENKVQENPEVKPKPKERVSTIPEISALADYARLKVIVSEDKDTNPVQEFPPNKKEGFYPLIHTRHSRRPVFTVEPQQHTMKEKTMPNNTEMTAKVNKEPKTFVYPITEKEHQRTGMFKLGDKERQDKMLSEGKVNENINNCTTTNVQHNCKSDLLTGHMDRMAQVGTQHVPLQATTSSQNVSEELTYLDKIDPPIGTNGHLHNKKENMTPQQKEQIIKRVNKDKGFEDKHKDIRKNEKAVTHNEQSTVKQDTTKQPQSEDSFKGKYGNREEERKIKHILEQSTVSHAEEERLAFRREEERRAREREVIAIKIKERREKQREAEPRTEEEKQVKQIESQRAQREDQLKFKQRRDDKGIKEIEKNMRLKFEEERRVAEEEQHLRAGQAERQGRTLKEEPKWRAANEDQQRKLVQEERRKTGDEEHQRKVEQELPNKAVQEEQQRTTEQKQQQRNATQEEHQHNAAQEERQRRTAQEQWQRRAAQEEQQRRAAQEEEKRRVALQEQRIRAAQEERQRRAAAEEQQRRAAQEEQQRRAAQEEQQKRAAQEEQQRRAAAEEQQRRAAQEEEQKRAALEEEKRRIALQEQQRRAAQEEEKKRAAQEEEKKRVALQEQQRRAAQEEQQRSAAQEEEKRRAALKEQQRRAEQELQRRVALQEQQREVAQEQERIAAQEKWQRGPQEEQIRRDAEELQRRASQEKQGGQEEQRVLQEKERATQEELQRRAEQEKEQRRAKQIITDSEEEKRKRQREENKAVYILQEKVVNQNLENKAQQHIEKQKQQAERIELLTRIQKHEEEENILKQREESQTIEQKASLTEESQGELSSGQLQEQKLLQNDDEILTKKKEEVELSPHREKIKSAKAEKQRQVDQMDALQYYAITSVEPEKKPRESKIYSPLPNQQRNTPGLEATDWPYRPHPPMSPSPALPRSTASSPAPGVKPSMFRVKDNTMRASMFTKSVKPRFHKNYAEDVWGGSPADRGWERGEDHEVVRHGAGTPVHPDLASNRLMTINEPSISRSVSSSDGYSGPVSYHRPFSRRSIVMDDDDSRSVFSTTSDGVESFATSAADLADIRGLYDYDRPESACSFSSDASRSMGKPPTVPPKSEKALRRAQRLTTRRMKKEFSKHAERSHVGLHKESPVICSSSSSTEVRSSNRHAVASPHFSPPVSLAHARTVGSSLPSSNAEQQSSHRSFHASPHATGPISLPNSSADANPAVTLPAAPKTVSHVPSSPTLHHVNRPAPVTQYQVESTYPQSYPLTQRKVLQDLGSGQYFVVDVPVEVKTKTFIDPETGKYVQLNVRESGQSIARHRPQETCPQPHQRQINQQLPLSQVSPAAKRAVLVQGFHGYPHNYQPAAIKSLHSGRSSAPVIDPADQQSISENQNCGYSAPETGPNPEGRRYSPEKTPYMDTVNDTDKRHNGVYSTHGSCESFPGCDTNSQLAGRSACENENSAPSQYQPREIITMSELEDFMDISDW